MSGLVLGGLAALALVSVATAARVVARENRLLRLPFAPDELHWARTSDGWMLPMGRYLPRGPRAAREPVILCHGMGANRFNLDLNERHSVARYLASRGFECFVVELRGSGITRRETKGRRFGFLFDDYVRSDLPALIAKAREVAGAERVLWVGHSKGGIVMYAYCAMAPRPEIAGVVAIGSPAAFPHFTGARRAFLSRGHALLLLDGIYVEGLMRMLAPLGRHGLVRLQFMASHENIEPQTTAYAMANLLGNISTGVTKQFARWIGTGEFKSWDGKDDYRGGLVNSKVPFQLIAGSIDALVAPSAVEAARDAMKQAEVEYFVAGAETGFKAEYGHGDLVLGRHAPEEIFPRVEAWLRHHGTRAE